MAVAWEACGYRRTVSSTVLDSQIDSSSDVAGMLVTRNMISCSFSVGMNSLPRKGIVASEATSARTAVPSTVRGCASERSSKGAYSLFRCRMTQGSDSAFTRITRLASTGISATVRIIDPVMAKIMLMASGLKSLPSSPSSDSSGMNTTPMIRMPKAMGLITSRAACRTMRSRSPPRPAWWPSRRAAFSTRTMGPSMVMPSPITSPPRDSRLADRP